MHRIMIMLLLAVAFVSLLPAAVTQEGEEAYELCRAAVSLLAYRDEDRGNDRAKGEAFINTLVSMKPEWEPSRFQDFLGLIHEAGVIDDGRLYVINYSDSRTRPSLLSHSGRIYHASDSDDSEYEWYEFDVEDFEVTYNNDNEIRKYTVDGVLDIKVYIIGTFLVIGIDSYDFETGGYDIGDSSFTLVTDFDTGESSIKYNGKILSDDDMMQIARMVDIAAYYLKLI